LVEEKVPELSKTISVEVINEPPSKQLGTKPKTTLNLGNIFKSVAEKEPKTDDKPRGLTNNDPIEDAPLREFWQRFADSKKNQVAEYHLLNRGFVRDGNTLIIHLNNAIEEPLLQSIKVELVSYLREKLKSNNLQLTSHLKEVTSARVAYTNKEKFEAMAEKNPMLIQLKDKFGLDPDF